VVPQRPPFQLLQGGVKAAFLSQGPADYRLAEGRRLWWGIPLKPIRSPTVPRGPSKVSGFQPEELIGASTVEPPREISNQKVTFDEPPHLVEDDLEPLSPLDMNRMVYEVNAPPGESQRLPNESHGHDQRPSGPPPSLDIEEPVQDPKGITLSEVQRHLLTLHRNAWCIEGAWKRRIRKLGFATSIGPSAT